MALIPLNTFSLDTSIPQFKSPPIKLRPFLIQGATTGIPPANPDRINILYKKNQDTPFYSMTASEYDTKQINTKNVIFNDYCSGTTLVDMVDPQATRYEFSFAATHTNDVKTTSDKNTVPYILSLVFINGVNIYHIQIPLVLSATLQPVDVNPFLRAWLDPSTRNESFSINQLLQMKGEDTIEFDRFEYQQNYNQNSTPSVAKITNIASFAGKYTHCILKTPHVVLNYTSLAKNDLSTFNDVFNYMHYKSMHIANPRFPLELSADIYLLANSSTKYPISTFYSIKSSDAAKVKLTEGFSDSCSSGTTKLLDSVKCYPIDLATQIDSNGNVLIDQETAKPIDTRPVIHQSKTEIPLTSAPNSSFNYTATIIIIVAFSLAFLIIGATVIYIFIVSESRGVAPAARAGAGAGAGAGALAATAATGGGTVGAAALARVNGVAPAPGAGAGAPR